MLSDPLRFNKKKILENVNGKNGDTTIPFCWSTFRKIKLNIIKTNLTTRIISSNIASKKPLLQDSEAVSKKPKHIVLYLFDCALLELKDFTHTTNGQVDQICTSFPHETKKVFSNIKWYRSSKQVTHELCWMNTSKTSYTIANISSSSNNIEYLFCARDTGIKKTPQKQWTQQRRKRMRWFCVGFNFNWKATFSK